MVELRQQHFQNINLLSERQVAEERQRDALAHAQRKELWLLAAVMALGAVVAVLITAALGLRRRAQWATAQQQQAQQALQMREASLQHLARSAHGMQLALQVSASVGVTYYPQEPPVDADTLLHQADEAMYWAKRSGRNRHAAWTPALANNGGTSSAASAGANHQP